RRRDPRRREERDAARGAPELAVLPRAGHDGPRLRPGGLRHLQEGARGSRSNRARRGGPWRRIPGVAPARRARPCARCSERTRSVHSPRRRAAVRAAGKAAGRDALRRRRDRALAPDDCRRYTMTFTFPEYTQPTPLDAQRSWTATFESYDQRNDDVYY